MEHGQSGSIWTHLPNHYIFSKTLSCFHCNEFCFELVTQRRVLTIQFLCYFCLERMFICGTSCGWTKWSALLWPFVWFLLMPQMQKIYVSMLSTGGKTQPLNTTSHLDKNKLLPDLVLSMTSFWLCGTFLMFDKV